jgi:hypothetical protein
MGTLNGRDWHAVLLLQTGTCPICGTSQRANRRRTSDVARHVDFDKVGVRFAVPAHRFLRVDIHGDTISLTWILWQRRKYHNDHRAIAT